MGDEPLLRPGELPEGAGQPPHQGSAAIRTPSFTDNVTKVIIDDIRRRGPISRELEVEMMRRGRLDSAMRSLERDQIDRGRRLR